MPHTSNSYQTPRTDAFAAEWNFERGIRENGRSYGWGALSDALELARQLERELAARSQPEKSPGFDAVQLSEARFYRDSKEPIGILARAVLRANGEMK